MKKFSSLFAVLLVCFSSAVYAENPLILSDFKAPPDDVWNLILTVEGQNSTIEKLDIDFKSEQSCKDAGNDWWLSVFNADKQKSKLNNYSFVCVRIKV